jgi:hypothetical protein
MLLFFSVLAYLLINCMVFYTLKTPGVLNNIHDKSIRTQDT